MISVLSNRSLLFYEDSVAVDADTLNEKVNQSIYDWVWPKYQKWLELNNFPFKEEFDDRF